MTIGFLGICVEGVVELSHHVFDELANFEETGESLLLLQIVFDDVLKYQLQRWIEIDETVPVEIGTQVKYVVVISSFLVFER